LLPQESIDPLAMESSGPAEEVLLDVEVLIVVGVYACIDADVGDPGDDGPDDCIGPVATTTLDMSSFSNGAGMKLERDGGPL